MDNDSPAAVTSASRGIMYRRIMLLLTALLLTAAHAYAQTPIEKLIIKYGNISGAKEISASGSQMAIARVMMKHTPVAPVAGDVDKVYILKMAGASDESLDKFESDLQKVLKSYEYYGTQEEPKGKVDVYVMRSGTSVIKELVVYNPENHTLNSFYGTFPLDALMKMVKE